MESSSVNWDLLPDHPEEFFGLTGEFDRKELKKRYHRLIKKFKPERFPSEFQRIRAAFELLDERLRYMSQADGDFPGFQPVHAAQEADAPDVRAAADRCSELKQLLAQQPPKALYRELAAAPQSAVDYYFLATLSDLVYPDNPLQYCGWILRGIEAHPNDAGLFQLLHAFCRLELTTKEAATLVQRIVKVVPGSLYFFLCEDLWLRLLRKLPFAKFARLLAQCEKSLSADAFAAKHIFMLSLLRKACWRADLAWLQKRTEELFENAEFIPEVLHYELDLLEFLLQYRLGRDTYFLDGSVVRSMLDSTLRAYFEGRELDAEKAFLEFQLLVQKNPDDVFDAFPLETAVFEPAMILYRVVSQDMESRLLDEEEAAMDASIVDKVWRLAHDQERRMHNSLLGSGWHISYLLLNAGVFVALIGMVIVVLTLQPRLFWILPFWLVAWYFLAFRWLRERGSTWLAMSFSRRLYRSYWREAAMRMVRVSRIEPYAIASIMSQIEDPEIEIHHLFSYYLSQDPALSLFAYSHRFV